MEILYRILLSIHIVFGSISLIVFWIPAIARKGKKLHVQAGKLYVSTMWVVVGSALSLCILNLINQNYVTAAFLGFLSVLTAYPLWYGVVVLKYKKDIPNRVLDIRRILNGLLFFGGIGLITWSLLLKLQGQTILLLIFGTLGLTSLFAVLESRDKARKNANWLVDHLNGMIVTGIAAYTAFFAFGGRTLFDTIFTDALAFIPWILPTIAGTISIRILRKKWAKA